MDAAAQHVVHDALERALGPEPAVVLMDTLAGCATKQDLVTLKHDLKHELLHEIDLRLDARFAAMMATLHSELRTLHRSLFFELSGLLVVVLAAGRLTG